MPTRTQNLFSLTRCIGWVLLCSSSGIFTNCNNSDTNNPSDPLNPEFLITQIANCSQNSNCSSDTTTSGSGATEIYLFRRSSVAVGNLGNRAATDLICEGVRSSNHSSLTCNNLHALISYSTDQISSFTSTYSLDGDLPVKSTGGTTIKSSWDSLLSSGPDVSLATAGIVTSNFWTGSNTAGVADQNCSNWTIGNNTQQARRGDQNSTGTGWIDNGVLANCDVGTTGLEFLCVCW